MQNFIPIILILILILIAIEDFRFRKISLIWVIGILITSATVQFNTVLSFYNIATNALFNLCIIAINYAILTLYFSLKNKKTINLGTHYLGIGDLLFLISISFLFSPLNFVFFLLFSLFFTLFYTILIRFILPTKFKTIPLAGLQAIFLVFVIITLIEKNKIWEINNDAFTLNIILKYVGNS